MKDLQTYLEELETADGPKIIQVEDPLAIPSMDFGEYDDIVIDFDGDNDISVDDAFEAKADDDLQIVWCPNCNKITTNEYRTCPNCNFPLDDYI